MRRGPTIDETPTAGLREVVRNALAARRSVREDGGRDPRGIAPALSRQARAALAALRKRKSSPR